MYGYIKKNRILLGLLALSLVICLFALGRRFAAEQGAKQYDVVLDYTELKTMAEQSEHELSWWLKSFADYGITKVGLTETSIRSLIEDTDYDVECDEIDNLRKKPRWREEYPAEFWELVEAHGYDDYDLILTAEGDFITGFLGNALFERLGNEERFIIMRPGQGERLYAYIDCTPDDTLYSETEKYLDSMNKGFKEYSSFTGSKLMELSLGFLPEDVDTITNAGCEIVPRTLSYAGWNGSGFANAVIKGYEENGIEPKYLLVGGQGIFGNDEGIATALEYMNKNGTAVCLIEDTTQRQNIDQDGVVELSEASGFRTVRAFSMWRYIQYRYQYYGYPGAEEIENTLFRAITERNIRLIYFKPILYTDNYRSYVTDPAVYRELFENLNERLSRHGITMGEASVLPDLHLGYLLKAGIGFGSVFGFVLLLGTLFSIKKKHQYILAALGCAAVAGAAYVAPNLYEVVAALAACIIFGCLALTVYTAYARRAAKELSKDAPLISIITTALIALLLSAFCALAGGFFTAGPLASINYMLEIDIFRGVKIGQLLPIAYFAAAYLAFFGYKNEEKEGSRLEAKEIAHLLRLDIKLWMLILGGIVALAGYYYIARTGHESNVEVSDIEMLFRNKMEEIFIARPRTKEFLIAFPCIMLMVYCAARRLRFFEILFGAVGVLGVTSIINTFEHIRSPLYLGLYRSLASLVIGAVLGTLFILVFELLYRLYTKYLKDRWKDLYEEI